MLIFYQLWQIFSSIEAYEVVLAGKLWKSKEFGGTVSVSFNHIPVFFIELYTILLLILSNSLTTLINFLVQKITHVNEKTKSKDGGDKQCEAISTLDQSTGSESNESNNGLNQRKLKSPSASTELHTKEYPCSECGQSLASRFRYHTIPKLKLRDTVWIPTNNSKSFFVVCYTELGPQSDGILDELRRAEIGIRDGTKVFIIPLSCALGIQKVVNKQKTLPAKILESVNDEEDVEDDLPVETLLAVANRAPYRFMKSVRARMTVHKIIGLIQQQSSLTFDYVFFCVLASIIAGLGLLENSSV